MAISTGNDRGMVNLNLMNMPLHPTAPSYLKHASAPATADIQAMISNVVFMEEHPNKKLTKALNSFIAFRCEFVVCCLRTLLTRDRLLQSNVRAPPAKGHFWCYSSLVACRSIQSHLAGHCQSVLNHSRRERQGECTAQYFLGAGGTICWYHCTR